MTTYAKNSANTVEILNCPKQKCRTRALFNARCGLARQALLLPEAIGCPLMRGAHDEVIIIGVRGEVMQGIPKPNCDILVVKSYLRVNFYP